MTSFHRPWPRFTAAPPTGTPAASRQVDPRAPRAPWPRWGSFAPRTEAAPHSDAIPEVQEWVTPAPDPAPQPQPEPESQPASGWQSPPAPASRPAPQSPWESQPQREPQSQPPRTDTPVYARVTDSRPEPHPASTPGIEAASVVARPSTALVPVWLPREVAIADVARVVKKASPVIAVAGVAALAAMTLFRRR